MKPYKFDRNAYLQRINYVGETTPTLDTLKALHHAQLYTIPFENLDVQLGRGIDLSPGAIFEKLVHQKRGGYCFELNGMFLMALKAFCFEVRPLLARTHVTGTPSGRGHQIELVTINGRQWIADVGFGADTPRAPIPLELHQPTFHDGQKNRLVDADHFGIMLQTEKDDEWINLYSFDLSHVFPADIDYGNHFNSTHPSSLFVFARVAALPVENEVPESVRVYWQNAYPTIGTEPENSNHAYSSGFEVLGIHRLPSKAWWDNYYRPLRENIKSFKQSEDSIMQAVIKETEEEMELFEEHEKHYGYSFYIMKAV